MYIVGNQFRLGIDAVYYSELSFYRPDGTKCQFNYTLFDENDKPQYHPCDEDVVSTCPPGAPQDISTKCYDESMNLLYTDMRNGQTDYPAYR